MFLKPIIINRQLNKQLKIIKNSMSVFIQSFDPIKGCSFWEEKNSNYDYHQEVARSAFADMLHDHERNEKYEMALKKAIKKFHSKGKKAHVLDIGTGTGLLSMMAAKCGADTITACEAFTPMAKCALEIIKKNGFADKIKLVEKRSTEMTVGLDGDMKERANILITEVFDTELIGEGALSTFKHAQEFLLDEERIVIPGKGTVWAQIVESPIVESWQRIKDVKDPDTGRILVKTPRGINECQGSSAVHDLQLSQLPIDSFTLLSPAIAVFEFDWSGKERSIVFEEKTIKITKALTSGNAQAVFFWWNLIMDVDQEIELSCAPVWQHPDALKSRDNNPDLIPWRDHWMQAIYYFPRVISLEKNQEISLVACHDEYSFWFDLDKKVEEECKYPSSPACHCNLHLAFSRSRIGQLNDENKINKYLKVIKNKINKDTICLCLSDCSFIGLAAASLGAKRVFILESNYLSRRAIEEFIKINDFTDKVEIIESLDKFESHVNIDFVFGEPYFVNSIFPWDNLRFFYLARKYFTQRVEMMPVAATIRGVAVEFQDLHKIRLPLGICEGFDMRQFDKLLLKSSEISDNPVEVQPLWEYPSKALGPVFDLAYFNFHEDSQQEMKFSGNVPIFQSGSLNGIALWIDWHLDSETIISTGPTKQIIPGEKISWDLNTRQGVYLFRNIQSVFANNDDDSLSWSFNYNLKKDRIFNFKFNLEK